MEKQKVEAVSLKTFGIKVGDDWFNISGQAIEGTTDTVKELHKGDSVSFEFDDVGKYKSITVLEKADRHDDMVNFEQLLTDAHKKGLVGVETEQILLDFEKGIFVFKATVAMLVMDTNIKTHRINEYNAHGDATPENVKGDHIKLHAMRMAETRAICRALRLATNNAAVAEEETK